jgi:hypothetical protein
MKEHAWDPKNVFQYIKIEDQQHLQKFFIDRLATVREHAIFGLGAAIYTQITNDEQCSSIWCSVASASTSTENLALTLKLIKTT